MPTAKHITDQNSNTLPTVTPVGADFILISDTSNAGATAKVLVSSLPGGGGGISEELAIAYAVAL